MALANSLASAGFTPTSVKTKADVHLNKDDKGFLINLIELTVDAVVPKVDQATFQQHVEKTKTGCIISRALGAIPTMNVKATLKN
jgi:osmotically inducible protein OsmC